MPRIINKKTMKVPRGSVYVGRPSPWGNPFIVGVHGDSGECVRLHREMVLKKVKDDPNYFRIIKSVLGGKDLVCFCAPEACHAEIYLELANEQADRPLEE